MNAATHEFRPIDRSLHKLLVVDDDPASRYATARLLRSAGFQTSEAANGAEGLAAAAKGDISAMVLDVHLPDLDGFELCRILRSRESGQRMPVLHLSAAYVTDDDKVRGLDAGADAYLTHPVEPAVLVATVQALVRTRVAEDAMRRSESKFRAIYDQAPSGIGLLGEDGRFMDANPAMLRLLGREVDAVVGHAMDDFVPPAFGAAVRDYLASTQADGLEREFPVVGAGGELTYLACNLSPHIEPGLHLMVATDVSQRALLERQRVQLLERERIARSEAENLNRMKDTFIAVLSHELRAPLNAIMGWTHVLQKRGGSAEMLRGLDAIERNGRVQARMISDLLDMSRMNMGKLPLAMEKVDPLQAVMSAVEAMQPIIDERKIELQVDAEPCEAVDADSARLQQIIWNLLSNAIKFSAPGGRVEVRVRQSDIDVIITVVDHGHGIVPAFLPFVFDRFMQSDGGRSRHRGGLGLGLSIVQQLVEAHGGKVVARSEGEGHGASFEVRLPRVAAPPVPAAEPPTAGSKTVDDRDRDEGGEETVAGALAAADAPSLAGVRILVVDDDAEATSMLQIVLSDQGAAVQVAGSVAAALQLFADAPFDVLLSDIGMPGQDGYDLMREIRQRERASGAHLRSIALTSFARAQDQDQARDAGFDAHCAKPLKPLKLMGLVRQLLGAGPRA